MAATEEDEAVAATEEDEAVADTEEDEAVAATEEDEAMAATEEDDDACDLAFCNNTKNCCDDYFCSYKNPTDPRCVKTDDGQDFLATQTFLIQ